MKKFVIEENYEIKERDGYLKDVSRHGSSWYVFKVRDFNEYMEYFDTYDEAKTHLLNKINAEVFHLGLDKEKIDKKIKEKVSLYNKIKINER